MAFNTVAAALLLLGLSGVVSGQDPVGETWAALSCKCLMDI